MYGLYSASPANNDPSDVLERRSSNSLLGRMEKMQQPWSEVVKEESKVFRFGGDEQTLTDSGELMVDCVEIPSLFKAHHLLGPPIQ